MYEDLTYEERSDGVGVITLARREVRNALRPQGYKELDAALRTPTARVFVLTGEDPAFCSGDDVSVMFAGEAQAADMLSGRGLLPAAEALLYGDVPVIAAVNGAAVGWGMELALMADIRIASERARFGELFVDRGLCSDVTGMARLQKLVGRDWATRLLLTGEIIDAPQAQTLGLVSEVVPHEALLDRAVDLASAIARKSETAVTAIKEGLRLGEGVDWAELGRWVNKANTYLITTEGHRKGVEEFMSLRKST